MNSNLFTIGLFLKSFDSPDDSVQFLKESNISEVYTLGRKLINTKLKSTKHFHLIVMDNMIETQNYTYSSTLIGGINGFFKIYNADYDSTEIHITADYPILIPADNFVGIEFIQKYLQSVNYENIFCKHFSNETIHSLLLGYNKNYKDLIFNIFEQVLTYAIGSVIAGTNPRALNISEIHFKLLYNILSKKSKKEIETEVLNAYYKLIKQLNLKNKNVQKYIEHSLPVIVSNIYSASKINTLNKIFYEPIL